MTIYKELNEINTKFYSKCSFMISNFITDKESEAYNGCSFQLNKLGIICRKAKITPKKVGQFVTFWKRNANGITEPFNENDNFDYYVINVCSGNQLGQFVFPKSVLMAKGIVSKATKEGKRGFRVYPSWDIATSAQAIKTQKWQLDYFWILHDDLDLNKVDAFYHV